MFFFIFFYLLLSFWEECRSFPHSRIYSTDEFQIQSTESNTTTTSLRKQVSNKFFSYLLRTPTCNLNRMDSHIASDTYNLFYFPKYFKRSKVFTQRSTFYNIEHAHIPELSSETPDTQRQTLHSKAIMPCIQHGESHSSSPDGPSRQTQNPLMLCAQIL